MSYTTLFRSAVTGALLLLVLPFSQAADYRIGLCYRGCPVGANPDNPLILRPIYALSFNLDYKSADWVAYKVSAGTIGIASSLARTVVADNFVPDTLDNDDFMELDGTGLVRSLYVPMVNFAGTPYWQDVNFTTNIVARSSALNQGAWYGLEWAIRNLVNREDLVYVVTGPIYRATPVAPQLLTSKPHRVPDGFFKIVVTEGGQVSAFIFDQEVPVYVHHCDLRSSIEEIEAATGLRFFPEADRTDFTVLDSSLGCF